MPLRGHFLQHPRGWFSSAHPTSPRWQSSAAPDFLRPPARQHRRLSHRFGLSKNQLGEAGAAGASGGLNRELQRPAAPGATGSPGGSSSRLGLQEQALPGEPVEAQGGSSSAWRRHWIRALRGQHEPWWGLLECRPGHHGGHARGSSHRSSGRCSAPCSAAERSSASSTTSWTSRWRRERPACASRASPWRSSATPRSGCSVPWRGRGLQLHHEDQSDGRPVHCDPPHPSGPDQPPRQRCQIHAGGGHAPNSGRGVPGSTLFEVQDSGLGIGPEDQESLLSFLSDRTGSQRSPARHRAGSGHRGEDCRCRGADRTREPAGRGQPLLVHAPGAGSSTRSPATATLRKRAEASVLGAPQRSAPPAHRRGRPTLRQLEDYLQTQGIEVETASSGLQGLARCLRQPFDYRSWCRGT